MKRKPRIEGAVYERNYVYNFHYHLVWVTKYRNKIFTTPQLVEEMKTILLDIAKKSDINIEEIEVMEDHVHMMLSFKPKYSATDVVKNLKGHSAKIFFINHPEIKAAKMWGGHPWSHSYYMGTVGNMSKETVRQYIQNQYTK